MLLPEEIQLIFSQVVDIYKKHDREGKLGKHSMPEFWPGYKQAVENLEAILPHAIKGVFPDKLFQKRAPNETEAEFNYRKENHKQITLPVFVDYISTVSRAWHDANWSIEYKETDKQFGEQTFKKYVEEEVPEYGSIENFARNVLPSLKAKDAEGVIAIRPAEMPINERGEITDGILLRPKPYYFSSRQIVGQSQEYYILERNERILIDVGAGRLEKKGRVFELYDDSNIWFIIQTGKYNEWQFKFVLFFSHQWKQIPVIKLAGIPHVEEGNLTYQSPFIYAVDNLDLALVNSSTLNAVVAKTAYPYTIVLGDPCDHIESIDGFEVRCNNGLITYFEKSQDGERNISKPCRSCNGSGLKSRLSPLGQMIITAGDGIKPGDNQLSGKPVEYVAPGTEILNFLREYIVEHENRARKILHLQTTDTKVSGSEDLQTATAKAIDLKALYAFVRTVSDQTFKIYEFILNAVGWMRYGDKFQPPVIVYPQSFDFKTEADYMMEISEAVKAGLPPFVIHSILWKFLQTLFVADQKTAQAFNLIINTDRLITLSNDEITILLTQGRITPAEAALHTSAINYVLELSQMEGFFELPLERQKELLMEKAKASADASRVA